MRDMRTPMKEHASYTVRLVEAQRRSLHGQGERIAGLEHELEVMRRSRAWRLAERLRRSPTGRLIRRFRARGGLRALDPAYDTWIRTRENRRGAGTQAPPSRNPLITLLLPFSMDESTLLAPTIGSCLSQRYRQ